MSTTRKMLKAEVTQLRAQLAATENMSRTKRIDELHRLEKMVKAKDERINVLVMELETKVKTLADREDLIAELQKQLKKEEATA